MILPLLIATASFAAFQEEDDGLRITEYKVGPYGWGWNRTIRINDDPFTLSYAFDTFKNDLGLRMVPEKDGKKRWVPRVLLLARDAIIAADAYLTKLGLGSYLGQLRHVYLHDFEKSLTLRLKGAGGGGVLRRPNLPAPFLGGSGYFYPSIDLNSALLLTPESALCTAVHEWFHLVQFRRWMSMLLLAAIRGEGGAPYLAAMEGTAEWASDLPIEFTKSILPEALVSSGRTTADALNYYYGHFDTFNMSGGHDGFAGNSDNSRRYETVFLWKSFARRAGEGEHDLGVIAKFWDRFSSQVYRGLGPLAESMGSCLDRYPGNSLERLRRFHEDYLADLMAHSSGPARTGGFTDDAFQQKEAVGVAADFDFKGHYSTLPKAIPADDAAGDDEIFRRLADIAVEVKIPPFGFRIATICPRAVRRLPAGATGIHILAWGEGTGTSQWTAAAMSHAGKDPWARGKTNPMDRLKFSIQDSGDGLTFGARLAYASRGDFNKAGHMETIWLALGNLDLSSAGGTGRISFAITPFFEAFPPPERPEPSSPRRFLVYGTCDPLRDPDKESFKPGDRITVRLDLSDRAHLAEHRDLKEGETTLRASVTDPYGVPVAVESPKYYCYDRVGWKYEYSFTVPAGYATYGRHRLSFTATSLLRLGGPDRSESDEFVFDVSADHPVVKEVEVLRGSAETCFHDRLGFYRPIGPGTATFRVTFDRDMDRGKPADIRFRDIAIVGEWMSERVWRGKLEIPSTGFADWKGVHALSIQAVDPNGKRLDADARTEGDQPDAMRLLVVDAMPPHVVSAQVRAEGLRYGAKWNGAEDVSGARDFRDDLGSRKLTVTSNHPLPDEQIAAELYLDFSQPLEGAPVVSVGSVRVPMKMSGTASTWTGTFPVADLRTGAAPFQIAIEARDVYGNALDAHPGTVPRLRVPASGGSWWIGYENSFASDEYAASGKGGVDLWHWLDASGVGEEWIEVSGGQYWTFHLLRRGDEVIIQYEKSEYRGLARGDEIEVSRPARRMSDIGTSWYDNQLRLIAPPPREVLRELETEYVQRGRVLSTYRMTRADSGRYEGKSGQLHLDWDRSQRRITEFISPHVMFPVTWTRKGPRIEEKTAAGPKTSQPPPRKAPVVNSWETYGMTHRKSGRFHLIDIQHVRFEETSDGKARLTVIEYPVTVLENHETNAMLWQVEWNAGETIETAGASTPTDLEALRKRAAERKAGGFDRSEIPSRIEERLGTRSRPR